MKAGHSIVHKKSNSYLQDSEFGTEGQEDRGETHIYQELNKNKSEVKKGSFSFLPGTMSLSKNFGKRSLSVNKSNFDTSTRTEMYTQDLGLNKYI